MHMIELVTDDALEAELSVDLSQRRMPDYSLYMGDEGAKNWLKLDRSREFPVARRLTSLLETGIPALLPFLPRNPSLVSIGTGNGEKERLILETLALTGTPVYYPIDVSSRLVEVSLEAVRHLPILKTGIVGRLEDLERIRTCWRSPVLLCVLGNTFSNFEADTLLGTVARSLGEEDLFLFDCCLFAPGGGPDSARERIEQTYRSRKNIHFNLDPLLRRGLRTGDVEFTLELLTVPTPAGLAFRTFKAVRIRRGCIVRCGGREIEFHAGETIRLGFTYKYTPEQVSTLVKLAGFNVIAMHRSPNEENILVLVRKALVTED